MSASSRTFRGTRDHEEIVVPPRRYGTTPRASALDSLIATDGRAAGSVARLALGLVMFPHGAQKMLGWFGGYGSLARSLSSPRRPGCQVSWPAR